MTTTNTRNERSYDKNDGRRRASIDGANANGSVHRKPKGDAQIRWLPRGNCMPHLRQHHRPRRDTWHTSL